MSKLSIFAGAFLLFVSTATVAAGEDTNLLQNGNFENKHEGWSTWIWSRDGSECASGELVNITASPQNVHSGTYAAHFKHTCEHDWSFMSTEQVSVGFEEKYELSYWVKVSGPANFKVGVVLYNGSSEAILNWDAASAPEKNDTHGEWVQVTGTVWIINSQMSSPYITVRCVGRGRGEAYVDDIVLKSIGKFPLFLDFSTGVEGSVEMRMDSQTGEINVTMPGTELAWKQKKVWGPKITRIVSHDAKSVAVELSEGFTATISLTEGLPEIVYRIASNGTSGLQMFPHPFVSTEGHVVIPLNEGISFPVTSVGDIGKQFYSLANGHGLCMAFWGVVDETSTGPGYMAIVDTPDDAVLALIDRDSRFLPYMQWLLQKDRFAYERVIRFRFFKDGGHVKMAKIFREYRKEQGLLATLSAKLERNPNVDLLVGSPNIWTDMSPRVLAPALQAAGIQRILWSQGTSAANVDYLNNNLTDVLTSRYDIYQDAMDPQNFKYLSGIHDDWTSEGFPDEIVYNSTGDWVRGWSVLGKDGKTWYYCGALCDKKALKYAINRTTEELRTKHYKCRFIDTTTASGWRECYHKDHPMTRTESKEWRMKLLDLFSNNFNLVLGSETGHEAAVPYLHYFEGMMSLGPYRLADSGRNIYDVVYDVPSQITRFQLGHNYRLPLWELVYHDCVVAYWYWGDYNNKLPPVWDKRDLFNVLYGVPPMFLINETSWSHYKERFVQSYSNTVPLAREVGYIEMLAHEFLTENRDVQQTTFRLTDDRVKKIIVNFNTAAAYTHPGTGVTVGPMSFHTYEDVYKDIGACAHLLPALTLAALCLLFLM